MAHEQKYLYYDKIFEQYGQQTLNIVRQYT